MVRCRPNNSGTLNILLTALRVKGTLSRLTYWSNTNLKFQYDPGVIQKDHKDNVLIMPQEINIYQKLHGECKFYSLYRCDHGSVVALDQISLTFVRQPHAPLLASCSTFKIV